MESRNTIFFEDVFPWKEAQENCSLKRTSKVNLSNHHQLEDDEVKLRKSKKKKNNPNIWF
jgi:hypothetical protein